MGETYGRIISQIARNNEYESNDDTMGVFEVDLGCHPLFPSQDARLPANTKEQQMYDRVRRVLATA